ncbi:hypothetical protein [Corynebacterium sp. ES2775-CONJ]|nr:hypothetical protein [Corynebacterium sp. ES2775-CONJ]MCS4489443.1 hypothetical protein [Corynebacterium sp. ES2775-CONJ]
MSRSQFGQRPTDTGVNRAKAGHREGIISRFTLLQGVWPQTTPIDSPSSR